MREERVTIFGNIGDIPPGLIQRFAETTGHLYGGAYPCRQPGLSDEEVIGRTRAVLAEAGILDHSSITLCDSNEERMRKILAACAMRRSQNGPGLYWIVDSNPDSLAEAARSIKTDLLQATTIISLKAGYPYDYHDVTTGVRTVALPSSMPPYPTHPTPAS